MDTKKYNVVLIDDDKFLLNMYSLKFSKEGMQVTVISSPEEALEKFREGFNPDIVMLDMVMPGMDGIELLTKIREEKLIKDAVVIFLSNQGQSSDIEKAQALGINGYIVKATTIPSEVLKEMIRIAKEAGK